MKNIINRLLPAVLLAIMPATMISCGNDEEDNPEPVICPVQGTNNFTGTTTTFPVDNPSSVYTSDKATYLVSLDTDSDAATLSIENADFLQGMPQLGVMTFNGLTYTIDNEASAHNGTTTVLLTCDALDPEIGNRPFPAFPITDLSATMLTGKSINLSFICTYRGTPYSVTFRGTAKQ